MRYLALLALHVIRNKPLVARGGKSPEESPGSERHFTQKLFIGAGNFTPPGNQRAIQPPGDGLGKQPQHRARRRAMRARGSAQSTIGRSGTRRRCTSVSTHNPLQELRKLGQSVWLDDIGRRMLADGSLARLIEQDGIAGVTSNPSILAHSITSDPQYAQAIVELLPKVSGSMQLYEALAIQDLRAAADLFRPSYDSLHGRDGFVSLEVSPHLAYDTVGSIEEGRRLWGRLDRVNAFIKIPGTEPGIAAIRELITQGVNVNVTLLFSPERYRAVAQAYCAGLEARVAAKKPIERIASVASFFLSRIDSNVDPQLDRLAAEGSQRPVVRGKAAIPQCLSRLSRCTRNWWHPPAGKH